MISDVTKHNKWKYRLLLAFGLFITSLFKRSLDAVLGIIRYPSQTGEFDCLKLHPRQCSAWHSVLTESNG